MKNVQVQMYILTGPFFKEKLWRLQNEWKKKILKKINWFYSFQWMPRKAGTDRQRSRKKIVWRNWWSFHTNSTNLDYELQIILNLDKLGLFLKALPEKGLMEKRKKSKGGKNLLLGR